MRVVRPSFVRCSAFALLTAAMGAVAGPAAATPPPPPLVEIDGPRLRAATKTGDARLTIVNVWATWCEPCKEEFPDLLAVGKAYADRGVRLWFVSTDFGEAKADAVRFLKAHKAPLPSYVKTGKDEAFIDALSPEWVGTLPATFIFDGDGRRRAFFQGRIERKKLEGVLDRLLKDTATAPAGDK